MPKLPKATADAVGNATSNRDPLPDGTYTVRLREVSANTSRNSGNPYWSWEYEVVDGPHKGRRLWDNTSLSEKALWRVNQVFQAFGVGPDTDTDELLGSQVRAVVSQREIEGGSRAGEIGNQIERLLPVEKETAAAGAGKKATPKVDDVEF